MNASLPLSSPLTTGSPEAILLQLLSELAATPDERVRMDLVLAAITLAIPCEKAFFYSWQDTAYGPQLRCSASSDEAFLNEYLARFRAIDPFSLPALEARNRLPEPCFLSADILSPERLLQTPFYTCFLAQQGALTQGLGCHTCLQEGHYASVRLFRRNDQPPFSDAEKTCLALFHQHVFHYWRTHQRLHALQRQHDAMLAGVNAMSHPVFLLDGDGKVILHNQCAQQVLQEEQRLKLINGHLYPGTQYDHASWLRECLRNRRLQHPPPCRSHLHALPSSTFGAPQHYAILTCVDPVADTLLLFLIDITQEAPRHSCEDLLRVFNFTHTEAKVAEALIAGFSTEEISAQFQVRRDTIRAHVKRLLAKTNTRGHADLQKLLLRLTPNLHSFQPTDNNQIYKESAAASLEEE